MKRRQEQALFLNARKSHTHRKTQRSQKMQGSDQSEHVSAFQSIKPI